MVPTVWQPRMTPGQLLSGFVGALIVFVLGVFREWWRNEQERRGILRLLWAEIDHNAEVVRTIADRRGERPADWIGHPDLPSLKAETWRGLQGRAAALLPNELTRSLLDYYAPLETSRTLLRFQNVGMDSADKGLRGTIKEMKPDWTVAATRNPYLEYLEQTLAAEDTARDRIREYLSLSWVDTLAVSAVGWSRRRQRRYSTNVGESSFPHVRIQDCV
jgi:hypothetical protein